MDERVCPVCGADIDSDDAPLCDLDYDRRGIALLVCLGCDARLAIQLEEHWRGETRSDYYYVTVAK